MTQSIFIQTIFVICSLLLMSCSGVTNHGSVTLDKKVNSFQIKVGKKHHNWYLGNHGALRPDETARAWATNTSKHGVFTYYQRFDLDKTLPQSKSPISESRIEILPGKRVLFFEGEISQLAMPFYKELPMGGATFRIDVVFDEIPSNPVQCSLLSNYGGP